MAIPSKAYKPHNFESHNSLKLSFKNIPDCDSFLESNSPGILALCETNLDGTIEEITSDTSKLEKLNEDPR